MKSSAPLTEKRYVVPFTLVTSLFFLWAIGVNINDILVQHLKKAFNLTDFQSSAVPMAFFGGYFLAALPAGWLMQRVGYKKGILIGLLTCASGAFLFIPASSIGVYGFFLFALFLMACGQSFLEVAANPYTTVLGPPETAERRINFAQSFNAAGAVTIVAFGSKFILSGVEHTSAELQAMTPQQLTAYQAFETSMVRTPYMIIAALFLLTAVVMYFSQLPEVAASNEHGESQTSSPELRKVFTRNHLVMGVIAQFLYVGAQVGVTSFFIRFVEHAWPGTPEKKAAEYLLMHLVGFLVGRFTGSYIMKHVPAPRLLGLFAACSFLCVAIAITSSGLFPVWAMVLLGFFHSIMFPTIFALSLKDLGPYTKLGSSLLVMAIIGGAACPAIMGKISDLMDIQKAFVIPLFCHAFIFYFALRGYRPGVATHSGAIVNTVSSEAE
jgi:FHS family L-fucose permease-like MFS transporter